MRTMAIYDANTRRVLTLSRGDPRSLSATRAALPEGRAAIMVPNSTPMGRYLVSEDGQRLEAAPPDRALALKKLRMERNRRLEAEADPVLANTLRLARLSPAEKRAWKDYRQGLLDITKGDPFAPEWPKKPGTT